jgi:type IV pilus assembly protein PilV
MPTKNRQMGQSGVTLFEVLISMLVVGLGLLGMAALRVVGVSNAHTSYLRSVASIHSENMAELMRANIAGVNANIYAQGAGVTSINYAAIDPGTPPDSNCRTSGTPCSPADQAGADAYHWVVAIQRDLPVGATGTVVCNDRDTTDVDPCTNGSVHSITVNWQEKDVVRRSMEPKSFQTVMSP